MKLTYEDLEKCNIYVLRKIGQMFAVKSPTSHKSAYIIKEVLKQQDEIEKSIKNFNINKLEQEDKLDENTIDYLIQLYGVKKSTIKTSGIVNALKRRQMQYANIIHGNYDIIQAYDPDAKTDKTDGEDLINSDEETENLNSEEKRVAEELQEVRDDVKKAVKNCVNKILKLSIDFSVKQQLVRFLQPIFDTVCTEYEDMIYLDMLKDVLSL